MGRAGRRRPRSVVWLVATVALLAGACGDGGGPGGGGGGGDLVEVDPDVPAVNELLIPPLLEPTVDGDIARYELSLTESEHGYGDAVTTSTLAFNEQSIFGPTLLWPSGGSLSLAVTNGLEEVTTTHWHGADVPAEADGGPWTTIEPGETWVADFEVVQPAATLWYHPHRNGTTAEQVYAGAVGLIIVEDDNPDAAVLPRTYGVDDIPIILQDKEFDDGGQLVFEINDSPVGDLNDELTVNGTVDPYVTVPDGLVRLRLLNGNQAWVQELSIDAGTMWKIAGDGGLLRRPVAIDNDRAFVLDETGDGWVINGDSMDMSVVNETIRFGDTERWTVTSADGVHAFHVHQTQFQIIEINGEPPGPEDAGWEDTVLLEEGDEVVLIARFDSYTNPDVPYMFHCHILDHEEDGMMGQFQVLDSE